MIYREVKGNLFDVGPEYYLVHCISADFKMGAGIAKTFADLGCREEILKDWDGAYDYWKNGGHIVWTSIPLMASRFPKGVCHLITKERYFQKPTYDDLCEALLDMRDSILFVGEENVKLAMPKIGCGLDKLEWDKVREIILKVFEKTDFEILVCSLN